MLKRLLKSLKAKQPDFGLPGWPKSRGYDLHRPAGREGEAIPLVIAIHGYTHDGAQMAALTAPDGNPNHPESLNSLADSEGFAVVYPYGTKIGLMPGRCWNAGGGVNEYAPVGDPARRKGIDDVQFFADLLSHLAQTIDFDDSRVYLLGISNGGAMAQRLAMAQPGKWAAVATVAGCNQFAAAAQVNPEQPMPLLHIHGTEDKIWPYEGGELKPFGLMEAARSSVSLWAECNGTKEPVESELEPLDRDDPTRVRKLLFEAEHRVELYTVIGGGHSWPCGHQYLPEKIVGKVSRQLQTNRLIWNFFQGYHN